MTFEQFLKDRNEICAKAQGWKYYNEFDQIFGEKK